MATVASRPRTVPDTHGGRTILDTRGAPGMMIA